MSHDQIIKELKDKACYQEEQIYVFREKLITYDKVIAKKEELQCQLNELKQWMEDVEFKEKQINTDLLNNLECQSKKLKKSELTECQLRTEKNHLVDLNDRMTEQLRTLTQNEQKLLNSIEELAICKNRLQSEITNANDQIEEQNRCIDTLSKTLRCKEDEYCKMRRQLEENRTVLNQLNETSKCQEKELECVKTELVELNREACKIEEKLKCERDTLCNELEIKCQRLREIEIEYDEARRNLCEEKANVCKLLTQMEEMRQCNEKEICEANAQIQKLKTEIYMKDESACRMKSQIVVLSRENECKCTEINALKSKVLANECLLEKIKHSSQVFAQMKCTKIEQLERDKSALEFDLKQKKKIICEMEREACRLKNAINNCCQPEHEVCCLRNKIKEFGSTNNSNKYCPVSKCESICTREIKSSCCSSPSNDSNCGYKNCKEPSSYSLNRITPIKTSNNDNSMKCIPNELKQLYCDLDQLKDTAKTRQINIC